jgi:hypothetical protein
MRDAILIHLACDALTAPVSADWSGPCNLRWMLAAYLADEALFNRHKSELFATMPNRKPQTTFAEDEAQRKKHNDTRKRIATEIQAKWRDYCREKYSRSEP